MLPVRAQKSTWGALGGRLAAPVITTYMGRGLLPPDHPDRVTLKEDRIRHWLGQGATPTDRVARFLGKAEIIAMPSFQNPIKSRP
ncbi:MAG: 30S ribosomal protein S16, partial [Proteobacteria bacterium]|nr:30S ribosomal protein S16 [Pseudomonadota bacterium]